MTDDIESDKYWVSVLLPGWIEKLKTYKPLSAWEKGQLSVVLMRVKERMEKELIE